MWLRQAWWRHRAEVARASGQGDAGGRGLELMQGTENTECTLIEHLLCATLCAGIPLCEWGWRRRIACKLSSEGGISGQGFAGGMVLRGWKLETGPGL